jgi:hypothetical protein
LYIPVQKGILLVVNKYKPAGALPYPQATPADIYKRIFEACEEVPGKLSTSSGVPRE